MPRLSRKDKCKLSATIERHSGPSPASAWRALAGGTIFGTVFVAMASLTPGLFTGLVAEQQEGQRSLTALVDGLTFSSDAETKGAAMATILDCARYRQCIPMLIEVGVVPHLIALLSSPSEPLQRDAASVLHSISGYNLTTSALFDESTIGPLMFLLRSRTAATKEHAAAMLRNMVSADADLRVAIVQQGALPELLRLLAEERSDVVRENVAAVIGSVAAGRCWLLDMAHWRVLMISIDFVVQLFKVRRSPQSRWAASLLWVIWDCQPQFRKQLSAEGIDVVSLQTVLIHGLTKFQPKAD